MKRTTALFLAAILCLWLAACSKAPEPEQSPQETYTEAADTEGSEEMQGQSGSSIHNGDAAEPSKEPVQRNAGLVGPWHLDNEKNDLAAFADSLDLFPGYGEWGASMEIRSDGRMSWYIGAEGWHGTCTAEGASLHAALISDLDQTAKDWDFRAAAENGACLLEMPYEDITVYWIRGEEEGANEYE